MRRLPLILSLLLLSGCAAVWAYSLIRLDGFERNWPDGTAMHLVLKDGLIKCTYYSESSGEDHFFRFPEHWRQNRDLFRRRFRWLPWFERFAPPPGSWELSIPLYFPTFLFALSSAWCWRRHRKSSAGAGFQVKPKWGPTTAASATDDPMTKPAASPPGERT